MLNLIITTFLIVQPIFGWSNDFPGASDEIKQLPGQPSLVDFRQYVGYLNASPGRYLFYYFVESQSKRPSDPIIQFVAGGPGGDSFASAFVGIGPWLPTKGPNNKTLKLVKNEFSWNKLGHALYITSPVGVGYSYEMEYKDQKDDHSTAGDSYLALQSFFKKFPHLRSNDFYISGLSYGGVYVPFLAREIVRGNRLKNNETKINLKGIGISNGLINGIPKESVTSIYLLYRHGLIDRTTWHQLLTTCGCRTIQNLKTYCYEMIPPKNTACDKLISQVTLKIMSPNFIFLRAAYNMSFEFEFTKNINAGDIYIDMFDKCNYTGERKRDPETILLEDDPESIISWSSGVGLTRWEGVPKVCDYPNYIESQDELCVDFNSTRNYLLSEELATAVGAAKDRTKPDIKGFICWNPNDTTCYYKLHHEPVDYVVKEIIESKQLDKIVIFNGDWDLICDALSAEEFVESLKLPLVEKHKKWIFGSRVVGFTKRFKGLTFVVVRGGGHGTASQLPGKTIKILEELIGKSQIN